MGDGSKEPSPLSFIKDYEENDIAGDRSGEGWSIQPRPDVRYQACLSGRPETADRPERKAGYSRLSAGRMENMAVNGSRCLTGEKE